MTVKVQCGKRVYYWDKHLGWLTDKGNPVTSPRLQKRLERAMAKQFEKKEVCDGVENPA